MTLVVPLPDGWIPISETNRDQRPAQVLSLVYYVQNQNAVLGAIVAAVSPVTVLFVLDPAGAAMVSPVPYDPTGRTVGSWHWPAENELKPGTILPPVKTEKRDPPISDLP